MLFGSILAGLYSAVVFDAAKGAMHEVYGAIVLLIATVLFIGAFLLNALGSINKSLARLDAVDAKTSRDQAKSKSMSNMSKKEPSFGDKKTLDGEAPNKQSPRVKDAWIQS